MNLIYKIELLLLKSIRRIYRALHKNSSYNHTTIADEQVSDYMKALLLTDKPCMVGRMGSVEFNSACYPYVMKKSVFIRYKYYVKGYTDFLRADQQIEQQYIKTLSCNAGFFPADVSMMPGFSYLMIDSMRQLDLLGVVPWNKEDFFEFVYHGDIDFCKYDRLEPYDYEHPWSKALEGKKVLVIHPFEKTIQMQYKKRELLFENKDVLPAFELITLKAVQTIAGEQAEFETWFDALAYMERKIDQIDFDVAIIGCGAYGFPLAAYCKKIGKKAIHLGGATQILFGIKGKRWEELPEVAVLMNEHWVRPLPEETPPQNKKVEGGCYW